MRHPSILPLLLLATLAATPTPAAADGLSLPLVFEANQGQAAGPVRFVARRPGYSIAFARDQVVLSLDAGGASARPVRIRFDGGAADAQVEGGRLLRGRANYLVGRDPAGWHTDLPLFADIRYRQLYPGVDLVMRGGDDEVLEYDFHVAPGRDPRRIGLRFDGARELRLDDQGNLLLVTAEGTLVQKRPVAYQEIDGVRRPVRARFVLRGADRVGFAVGAYDRRAPLVIDPTFSYSTYLGGDGTDRVNAVATDAYGYVYVAGYTSSMAGSLASDFPTKSTFPGGEQLDSYPLPPPEPRPYPSNRKFDAFVGKLDTTQSGADSLIYMSFFGGGLGDEFAYAIAVGPDGSATIGGRTSSRDLPLVNPLQTCLDGGGNVVCDLNMAFVARIAPSGTDIDYASYVNGHDVDEITALALGPGNRLYIGGRTASLAGPILPVLPSDPNYHYYFPITAGALQPTNHGIFDAFVMVLDTSAASPAEQLVYSTMFGGCADDGVQDLAVDGAGRVAVVGQTQAPCANPAVGIPLRNPIQATYAGGLADAFVASINPYVPGIYDPAVPGSSGLIFSTFLGGRYDEDDLRRSGLALDGNGNIYVAGTTSSPDFPTTLGAAQRCPGMSAANASYYNCDPVTGEFPGSLPPNGAVFDGYVAALGPTGQLLHGTYLGGAGQDTISDVAVDDAGQFVYLVGSTTSTGLGSSCAPQPALALGRDAFQATLRLTGPGTSTRSFFTYLGGGSDDFALSIAYEPGRDSLLVGGYATYNSTTKPFPITASALQPIQPGSSTLPFDNGFLTEIPDVKGCAPDLTVRKFGNPEPAGAGCDLTYTIEVQNLGTVGATGVVVTDAMPSALTPSVVTSTHGSCTGTGEITCALGSLAVGEKATITIATSVAYDYPPTQPPLVNTAFASCVEEESDLANDFATWVTHVQPATDSDGDGIIDCTDECPSDPDKSFPGLCGCGNADYPDFTVSDAQVVEGDSGITTALFSVELDRPSCIDLAFTAETAVDGDPATAAQPGEDYVEDGSTFIIAAGDTSHLLPVAVLGDTLVEPDEYFLLVVTPEGPMASAIGLGTIFNDDIAPVAQLSGPSAVAEGELATYAFTVQSSEAFSNPTAGCGGGSLVGDIVISANGAGGGAGSFSCLFADGPDASQVSFQVEASGTTSNIATVDVGVSNVAPAVSVSGATSVLEGDSEVYSFVVTDPGSDTFDLVAGWPDCGAAGLLVAGSLVLDPAGSGGSFECWFADGDAAGAVSVKVVDSDGAVSGLAALPVAVANVPPTVALSGPTSATEGETVTYQLSVFDPGDSDVGVDQVSCGQAGSLVAGSLTLVTADGDGGLVATGSFACLFAAGPAVSTVTATAFDPSGDGDPVELQVVIDDVAPVIALSGPTALGEGEVGQFSFTADAGTDSFALTAGYPDCGAAGLLVAGSVVVDAAGGGFACQFPAGPATSQVRVQIVDSDGKGSNIAEQTVTVDNLPPTVSISGPTSVVSGATATYQFAASDPGNDPTWPAAGYPDCGVNGSLVAGSLVVTAQGGSFQCAFVAGPANSQVSIRLSDADDADGNLALLSVVIAAPTLQSGFMHGQGQLSGGAGKPTSLAFSLACGSGGQGQSNLHLMAGGHRLKLEQVTGAACSDAAGIDPGLPIAPFDTLTGTGVGRYDGVPGYQVAFTFTDAGEPGTADTAHVTISDGQGNLVLDVAGTLAQGNFDAQP